MRNIRNAIMHNIIVDFTKLYVFFMFICIDMRYMLRIILIAI